MIHIPKRDLILPPDFHTNPSQYMDPAAVMMNRMRGRYRLRVWRSDGTLARETPWFDNVITNGGLDLFGARSAAVAFCLVGTGSTAPAVTDTGLTTFLASTSTVTTGSTAASGTSPYMAYSQFTYRFAAGVATGNISEVGVGNSATNTNIFSHALILDGTGTPTTITVLSTEALDVTYQIQNFPPLVDVNSSVTLSSTTYTTLIRASQAGAAQSWALSAGGGGAALDGAGLGYGSGFSLMSTYSTQTLGAITGTPAGSASLVPVPSVQAYTTGNYYRDTNLNFALGDGNSAGGVGSMILACGASGRSGQFQVSFTPVIPKDGSHIMTMIVRHTFARYP
jgi:hypothetical protein